MANKCKVPCQQFQTCQDIVKGGCCVPVPREDVAYVTCTYRNTCIEKPDFLAVIDLDPCSPCYGQVINRLFMPNLGDELHSAGWITVCVCPDNSGTRWNKLIVPGLISSRIYVVDVGSRCHTPRLCKIIPPECVFWRCDKGYLNVPRQLPCGDVLIANLGDPAGNSKGGFVVLDGHNFELKGNWENECEAPQFGYEFWFQPCLDVLISSSGIAPKIAGYGFCPDDYKKGVFGRHIYVWNLSCRNIIQCIDLGEDSLPLSVKFLHNRNAAEGYVSCALSGVIYRFYKCQRDCWEVEEAICIPDKEVTGWIMPRMPAFIVDIVISPDDRFLYVSNWWHGDVRQYELTRGCKPRLVGQVFVGGSIVRCGPVAVCRDEELKCQPEPLVVKCRRVYGGPSRLQLSRDGRRLYVTTSFYSAWDRQFYPDMVREGAVLVLIDVDTERGGLCVNKDFLVDFGKEPCGPCLAKDIHFPCGDATTEVFS
ncbi:methanethiol oxidase-like [Patagioenas fasciata]|uniref:methanethiol oxidase-like n=1 Tax=Patagioenas fasciata TaxID=372321 RepID=UPI003A98E13C